MEFSYKLPENTFKEKMLEFSKESYRTAEEEFKTSNPTADSFNEA